MVTCAARWKWRRSQKITKINKTRLDPSIFYSLNISFFPYFYFPDSFFVLFFAYFAYLFRHPFCHVYHQPDWQPDTEIRLKQIHTCSTVYVIIVIWISSKTIKLLKMIMTILYWKSKSTCDCIILKFITGDAIVLSFNPVQSAHCALFITASCYYSKNFNYTPRREAGTQKKKYRPPCNITKVLPPHLYINMTRHVSCLLVFQLTMTLDRSRFNIF